jgi:hypothetical protein
MNYNLKHNRNLGNNNTFQIKFPLIEDKDQKIYESYQGVLISLGVINYTYI